MRLKPNSGLYKQERIYTCCSTRRKALRGLLDASLGEPQWLTTRTKISSRSCSA